MRLAEIRFPQKFNPTDVELAAVYVRIGCWKLENWRLYRYTLHHAVKNSAVTFYLWDKIYGI